MINKIKKILLNSVNKLTKIIKKLITKNKHKINWHSIKKIRKNGQLVYLCLGM